MNSRICFSLVGEPTKTAGRIFKAASYCWVGLAISNWAWKSTSTISRSVCCSSFTITSMYSYSPAGIRNRQHASALTPYHLLPRKSAKRDIRKTLEIRDYEEAASITQVAHNLRKIRLSEYTYKKLEPMWDLNVKWYLQGFGRSSATWTYIQRHRNRQPLDAWPQSGSHNFLCNQRPQAHKWRPWRRWQGSGAAPPRLSILFPTH